MITNDSQDNKIQLPTTPLFLETEVKVGVVEMTRLSSVSKQTTVHIKF